MEDVMIDLETLSVKPNAVILTIGAAKFNRNGPEKPLEELNTFYKRIQIQSCLSVGLQTCKETVKWWTTQDKEARLEAFDGDDRIPLKQMLDDFTSWFGTNKNTKIWSHGDDFDCVILASAFRAFGMEPPWKFWNTRDTRTLFDLANFSLKSIPNTKLHHALYDTYAQILGVQICIQELRKNEIKIKNY
tara:strand:- start:389 stop:955 length:567 start_codon:yes stop_codon:yes gene_type:complete